MTDRDENPMSGMVPPSPGADDQRCEARRRLLKAGAVGAPLILTFRSTSAWAVSAGCLVEPGTLAIPGPIPLVDENGNPVPAQNPIPDQPYETIYVTQDPFGSETDRIVDSSVDPERLRSLVYNQNIGQSCAMSIMNPSV